MVYSRLLSDKFGPYKARNISQGFTLRVCVHVSGHYRHTDIQNKILIVIFKLKYCKDLL